VIAVKPMPKPGWALEIIRGKYAKTYDFYGTALSEGVKELVWTGNLPDEYYDEFVFMAKLTDALQPGSMLYFPAIQECAQAAERWIEIPEVGKNPDSYEFPAPGLKLLPAK
jgi:periplasmic copper chaperone A